MKRDEKIKLVSEALAAHCDATREHIKLVDLVGQLSDSAPLWKAFCRMQNAMLSATSAAIGDVSKCREPGCGVVSTWLEWFIFDNDCGAQGFEAKVGGVVFRPRTAAELVDLIEAFNAYKGGEG